MAGTVTIPLTTLAAGAHDFGPVTVQASDNLAVLTIDRTVAGGLDATPAAQLNIAVNVSADGGATYQLLSSAGIPGGPQFFTDRGGTQHQYTASVVQVGLDQVHGDRLKATVTVSGVSVAVAGSLAIT